MSSLVKGVQCYRCIPPPSEAGVTVRELACALGVTERSVQRMLLAFERHGMVRKEPGNFAGIAIPSRWWRA